MKMHRTPDERNLIPPAQMMMIDDDWGASGEWGGLQLKGKVEFALSFDYHLILFPLGNNVCSPLCLPRSFHIDRCVRRSTPGQSSSFFILFQHSALSESERRKEGVGEIGPV